MNRTAIAFLAKDRIELSKRTIEPLLQPDKVDLWWIDGSTTNEGRSLSENYYKKEIHTGVRGGPDAAIVYALTTLLAHGKETEYDLGASVQHYDYIGLCENDVLLGPDWFDRTMALFERGRKDGLNVGAVSPRCYEDRILIQRDGCAVMHNLGAGIVIFTREAARLILDFYRTAWSTDNRNTFCQLSGIDIGTYWAFRGNPQWLTADWGFDAILARAGLASLALTPSPVEMIGQSPSLAKQGLALATGSVEHLRNNDAFETYVRRLSNLWRGKTTLTVGSDIQQDPLGNYTIFPHQVHKLNGIYAGDWRLKWTQGFGPFSWRSISPGDSLIVPLSGHCELLVGGGSTGAHVEVIDDYSGFTCSPVIAPEGPDTKIMAIAVPAGVSYREVRLTSLTPGAIFYGIRTREPQVLYHPPQAGKFDWSVLPPAA